MIIEKPDKQLAKMLNGSDLIKLVHSTQEEKVPRGWYTMRQWAKVIERSPTTARRYIAEGLEKGLIQEQAFKIKTKDKVYPVPHYKIRGSRNS